MIPSQYSSASPAISIAKTYVVVLLAALFEVSPAFSAMIGRVVLRAWPGFVRS
jgi:hypothetical protein